MIEAADDDDDGDELVGELPLLQHLRHIESPPDAGPLCAFGARQVFVQSCMLADILLKETDDVEETPSVSLFR